MAKIRLTSNAPNANTFVVGRIQTGNDDHDAAPLNAREYSSREGIGNLQRKACITPFVCG